MPPMLDDDVRRRLRTALDMKGLIKRDWSRISKEAGCSATYLWEVFSRNKGSLEGIKKIADHIGVNWNWLQTDDGVPFPAPQPHPPINRGQLIAALETLMQRAFHLDQAMAADAAQEFLDIVEHPPNGSSTIDILSRVRTGILGALRRYERPRDPKDNH